MSQLKRSTVCSILVCISCMLAATAAQATAPLQITFAQGTAYTTGNKPDYVAVAVLTTSGKQDLVVVNDADSTVSVLLGNGDGTFKAKQDFSTCAGPIWAQVADINQDGKPDLVVLCSAFSGPASSTSSTVSVLLGNGDGTFQTHVDYSLQLSTVTIGSFNATQLLIGDLNNDGYPDVVAVATRLGLNSLYGVEVLMNAGAGHNGALLAPTLADSAPITSAVLADFNGGNNLDIAYAENDSGDGLFGAGWAFGNGAGTFSGDNLDSFCSAGPTCIPTFSFPASVLATGDMNGDGNLDLVYVTSEGPCVMLGDGKGGFTACVPETQFQPQTGNTQIELADFNNSGHLDLVALYTPFLGNICQSITVGILNGQGDGMFQAGPVLLNNKTIGGCPPTSNVIPNIATGDFNGDGLPDVVVVDSTNSVDVFLNTSSVPDQAPVASNASIKTAAGIAFAGTLTATQSQGSALSYSVVSNPSHGTVNLTNTSSGSFTYTSSSNFFGQDTFTFRVNDGYQYSNTATVSIVVGSIPTASNNSVATSEGMAVSGVLSGSDPGNNTLTFSVAANGSKGTAKITNASTGAFIYTPASGQTGQDTFTFQVSNGFATAAATETVFIGPATSGGKGDLDLLSLGGLLVIGIARRRKRAAA